MGVAIAFMIFALVLALGVIVAVVATQRDVSPSAIRAAAKSTSRTRTAHPEAEVPSQAWPLASAAHAAKETEATRAHAASVPGGMIAEQEAPAAP